MSFNLTVVSAYSKPESIVSYIGDNTRWFYIGYHLENYQKFHLKFEENKCRNVSSPREYQGYLKEMQQPFVNWLEKVHNIFGKSIDHWASEVFRGDPYRPDLFIIFCSLSFLRPVIESLKNNLLVVVENPVHAVTLSDLAKTNGVRFVFVGKGTLNIQQYYRVSRRIANFLYKSVITVLSVIFALISKKINNIDLLAIKPNIIVDTFLYNDSFDKNNRFNDRNFPGLSEFFEGKGHSVARYPIFYAIGLRSIWGFFQKIRKCRTQFILTEDFLKIRDYVYAFMYPMRHFLWISKRFIVPDFDGINVNSIVREEEWRRLFSWVSVLALLRYKLPLRLRECGVMPERYIVWDENQVYERCSIRGFREHMNCANVIGTQINIPPRSAMGHFPTKEKSAYKVSAHHYIVPGRIGKRIITSYFDKIPVTIGASLILRTNTKNRLCKYEEKKDTPFIIIVALTYSIQESLQILSVSLPAIRKLNSDNHKILIKPHPTCHINQLVDLIKKNGISIDGFEWTDTSISSLLTGACLVISGFSSVTLEAVCDGVPVILILNPVGLNHNQLEEIANDMWRDAFNEEEFEEVFFNWALKHPLSLKERCEMGKNIAELFFEENTEENMSKYLSCRKQK